MIVFILLFVSLGLDTLAVAISLGLAGLERSQWLRVGLTFSLFEGMMPAVGLLLGSRLGASMDEVAGYSAAIILIVLGLLEIRETLKDDDDDHDLLDAVKGKKLLLTGLSVSLDELAIGFSLGALKTPLGLALLYIGVQAFCITFIGLWLGRRAGQRLGERAGLLGGIILLLLGILLLIDKAAGLHLV